MSQIFLYIGLAIIIVGAAILFLRRSDTFRKLPLIAIALGVVLVIASFLGVRPDPLKPLLSSETPEQRVSSFAIMAYDKDGKPAGGTPDARRNWKRINDGGWMETYPNGSAVSFEAIGRFTLGNCSGTAAKDVNDQSHRVFIPDKGCKGMPFSTSDDGNKWGVAAPMIEVQ